MHKFQCLYCGSTELSYEKWIYCEDRVFINPDGQIEYYDQQIDDGNVFGVGSRYICHICKTPVLFHGHAILTEAELQDCLAMSLDERAEMQAEYEQREEQEAQIAEKRADDEQATLFADPEN